MVEYLDPEIAGEGEPATVLTRTRTPRPHILDYAALKDHPHYGQYFDPHVMRPFPSWLYHKTKAPIIVQTAREAAKYGVTYDMTEHRYNVTGEWSHKPLVAQKASPHVGPGKSIVAGKGGGEATAADVIAAFLKTQSQSKGRPEADIAADPDYEEFLKFKAFKAQQARDGQGEKGTDKVAEHSDEEKKTALLKVAEQHDIKIDKRWNLERIEEELQKHDPAKSNAA